MNEKLQTSDGSRTDRRHRKRIPVSLPGTLYMSRGRVIPIRLVNVGGNGALMSLEDFEHGVDEHERVVLEHPGFRGPTPHRNEPMARTTGVIVRVEVDFDENGITRHVAVYFDGGPAPDLDRSPSD